MEILDGEGDDFPRSEGNDGETDYLGDEGAASPFWIWPRLNWRRW
jgi:hypothetical protein